MLSDTLNSSRGAGLLRLRCRGREGTGRECALLRHAEDEEKTRWRK